MQVTSTWWRWWTKRPWWRRRIRCKERRWRGRCWTIHPFFPKLHTKFEASHLCCIVMEFCSEGDLHPLCHKEIVGDREGCNVWKLFVCWENYGKVKKSCFGKKYCIKNLLEFFFFFLGLNMYKFLLYLCILEEILKNFPFPFFPQFGKEKKRKIFFFPDI